MALMSMGSFLPIRTSNSSAPVPVSTAVWTSGSKARNGAPVSPPCE